VKIVFVYQIVINLQTKGEDIKYRELRNSMLNFILVLEILSLAFADYICSSLSSDCTI
jgi:hypothetical protein